tara:strand:- start:928 stop:1119 length:192 start_codon:yes stop_codon:yes gene_type:complete
VVEQVDMEIHHQLLHGHLKEIMVVMDLMVLDLTLLEAVVVLLDLVQVLFKTLVVLVVMQLLSV